MRNDPLASVSIRQTPQTQRIPGRKDQVRDNAGGYVFAKDVWRKVEDFLVLGTAGGTFYVGEDRLTTDNVDWLLEAVAADGRRVVDLIVDKSASRPPKAPKNRACVFALAAVFARGDADAVQAAKAAFPKVVRTTFDLSMFFGYSKQLRGKAGRGGGSSLTTGRALRTAIGSWFMNGDVAHVAWKACKARQRKTPSGEAFALRDAARIAHPRPDSRERDALLGWLAGKKGDAEARALVPAIDAFLEAQAAKTEKDAVRIVTERRVPWEYLPSQLQSSAAVWEALAPGVGMTALIRNLARMTRMGVLKPFSPSVDVVTRRLTDEGQLLAARIHPMDVFLALRVYASGRSEPNPKEAPETWTPVAEVLDALETAYDLSFGHVQPSGRKLIVAVDSSGSMDAGSKRWPHYRGITFGGASLGSPYEVASAMAVMLKRIEGPNVHVIDIDRATHPSKVTARTTLREISSWRPSGGGTDLSLPFAYATAEGLEVDGFAVLTDGETWAGRQHPTQALEEYRRRHNPAARVVVAAMAAVGHTIGDPHDEGVLNVVGMDASLPRVLTEYMRASA